MSGTLENSITLDDVFTMVGTRRVPLAPELAGYLALEVAESADPAGGDVDPRSVYIADEGTVALVRPRRDGMTGDAEASIRAILGRLLDASGSQTPALASTARRKSQGNLHSLSLELEAALIPVNRAAGRRALARLAREVKRVTLGVGRNAPPSAARPPSGAPPEAPARVAPAGRPRELQERPRDMPPQEPPTARRAMPKELMERAVPPPAPRVSPPEATPLADKSPARPTPPPVPPPRSPARSAADVDSLLRQFGVSGPGGDQAVSRELKAIAGLDPTPPPPKQQHQPPPSLGDESVEALLAMTEPSTHAPAVRPQPPAAHGKAPTTPAQAPMSKRAQAMQSPQAAGAGEDPAVPSQRAEAVSQKDIPTGASIRRPHAVGPVSTAGEFRRPRRSSADRVLVLLIFVLIAVGVVVVWMVKPGFLTGRTPEKIAQEKASAEAAHQRAVAAQQAAACRTSLQVTDVPQNAEVLLRVGQAPVDVERMPVGARLEFVATAEGFAPKRTVVPGDAKWDTGPDGKPRFEVGVQLDKSTKPKGELWPAGEPGSEVGGKGPPGTVHIVSTPRGAEVWLLAGIGPEAHVEQLPCDADVDVLVAGPTTLRKRLHVASADFAPDPAAPGPSRVAKISAK
jgi:hypothetical protein